MSFKEFIRPTLTKTIISLIILIIFIPFIGYGNGVMCVRAEGCPSYNVDKGTLLGYTTDYFKDHVFGLYIYKISFINLLAGLVLSYIISCLIILTYNNLKKSENKSKNRQIQNG
ncbi:hypothetical protein HYT23_05145 [Candidatus Pacearchaeota archaeon]|nr:hypothetical protein [Candidatus Pacearchaeota archaeon]